ncbi:MAG: molecular chaperone GrpE [Gammaproteobacteria bacterium]|jgi:molecular chaperone GrpE
MVNNEPPNPQSDAGPDDQLASNDVSDMNDSPADSVPASLSDAGVEGDPEANSAADPWAIAQALRDELEQARAESGTQREQALRAVAESDNVRKRAQRDLENAHKFALERFVNELLPVKDSLELGLAAAQDSANIEDLIEGTQMTLRLLCSAVEKFGVREVAPVGEPFDPEVHQAMTAREADGQPAGTVLEVVQKGYLLNERLVRPAMVVVSK